LTPLATRQPRYLDAAEFLAWLAALPEDDRPGQLTHMREVSSRMSFARIVVGGKTGDARVEGDAYVGAMPGIVEETILTLEAGRVPVVIGAYGGAALDLAIAMELLPNSAALQRGAQNPSYAPAVARAAQIWRGSQARAYLAQLTDFAGRDDTDMLARDVARFVCGTR
jgi:hypothetical protein